MQSSIFTEVFSLLVIAVICVWLFKRIHLPPILAYLCAGMLAGPFGLTLIHDYSEAHFVAELGIVFLLFTLGLEFSIPKLLAMRHIVFGLGTSQVTITAIIFIAILLFIGQDWLPALAIAGILALSSTAIVIKQLSETGELHSRRGQLAVGILLFQDIAVVPLLIAIPLLASNAEGSLFYTLLFALGKGLFVCVLLLAIGKWVLPRVFNAVAEVRTDELFVLTTLLVALIAGGLTHAFGLSMALGAFMAGMMLGESQYRHQLEADIRPFRDILMGFFFTTVGMQLDLSYVFSQGHILLLGLAALILIKTLIIKVIAQLMGEKVRDAWSCGLMLCQMGEFGFVLIAMSLQIDLIPSTLASLLIGIGVFSMALTPFFIDKNQSLAGLLCTQEEPAHEFVNQGMDVQLSDHVLICGFGRVGQTISRFLKTEAIPFVALDIDPVRVREAQAAGEMVQFGHAKQKDILKSAGVEKARLVIITFKDFKKTNAIVENVKQMAPEVKILVRMKDDRFLADLKKAGVTEVVPESLEASLMLASHVLHLSGVPIPRVLKRVREERKNRYGLLHGFYPGENTEINLTEVDRLEHLHAVALTDDAYAVGKSILELKLYERRVEITGLRREGKEIESPDPLINLSAQDILVLRGKPRRLERAERFILEGD